MTPPPPGYRTQSPDTSYAAEQVLIEAWRRMSLAEKARRVSDDCRAVERLALAGIRLRYPSADAREIQLRLAALRLGRDLTIAAFGWDPIEHGY
jgi:hypothetical protein